MAQKIKNFIETNDYVQIALIVVALVVAFYCARQVTDFINYVRWGITA